MSTWLLPLALLTSPQNDAAPTPAVAASAATPAPHVEWQRTLADALAVQQATGRPLLICVNTDGEQFCDRFASETYVDAAFVATTRGWVCVVASPDRHNESDYDGLGRRIECPRFPGCTCGEHIAIEPDLYSRWFKNQRYAPRHVGVGTDGKVLFDHFLDRSMQDAIADVEKHKGPADDKPLPTATAALLVRRDAASRRAAEAAYRRGDAAARKSLLAQASKVDSEPLGVIRMGLREPDAALFAAAVAALCAHPTAEAGIDLQDALARCTDAQAQALLAAAEKVAKTDSAMARFLVHRRAALRGLQRAAALRPAAAAAPEHAAGDDQRTVLEQALDRAERAAHERPKDTHAAIDLAIANVEFALYLLPSHDPNTALWFEDARRAAVRAAASAVPAERAAAAGIQAIALRQAGNDADAQRCAAQALAAIEQQGKAVDLSPAWVAELLRTAARSAAGTAYQSGTDAKATAPDAVADAAFAFALLAGAPQATDADQQQAGQLLAWAGARQQAQETLRAGVRRFPGSRELHDELRRRLVADRGADGLRAAYAEIAKDARDSATALWFAGYADLVAAELLVGDQQRDDAIAAYTTAIERLRQSAAANADFADSANHFAVLALAGRALERHLRGDGQGAVDDLLAALALRPASMTEKDGRGRVPDAILRRIARELREQGKTELAARLPG